MSNVLNLAQYRKRTRKTYLSKYGTRLNRFLERFVEQHMTVDFRQMASDYQAGRFAAYEGAWDYVHFREILAEAMDEVFGELLYGELQKERWFDARVVTKDELVERCLSLYIMNECQYGLAGM